jgi:hypothetical protein
MDQRDEAKELLVELGLFSDDSTAAIEPKIYSLNMRQLDRLKMMFGRIDATGEVFPESTRSGIRANDFAAFAAAVRELYSLLNEKA